MNYISILGASGTKTQSSGTTSFQIYKNIIIDAGNVIKPLGEEVLNINHIFITHTHSDHIIDLPFIIESFFEERKEPLTIYGSSQTIEALKKHTFNDQIWPDFSKIKLINSKEFSLKYQVITENETIKIDSYNITSVKANHIDGAFGYIILKDDSDSYFISGDTYTNPLIWETINSNKKIKSLIIECSFPNKFESLAQESKHLTPKLLKNIISKINRNDVQIFIYHLKPSYKNELIKEIEDLNILSNGGKILEDGDVIHLKTGKVQSKTIGHDKFDRIMEINNQLSSQVDKDKLFEMILSLTRDLTNCEAGTLYIVTKDRKSLEFKVIQNDPLNIKIGEKEKPDSWNSLPIYLDDGKENRQMVSVVSALEKRIINIPDVYNCKDYDFEGTKKFDNSSGYRSESMLVIPLVNHEEDVIGVLQLINKTNFPYDNIVPFNAEDEDILKALASQAAMALTNSFLINSLEEFLNSFVTTIAHAIDAKSKHTSKHIDKVAKIANLIAKSIDKDKTIYKDITYNENDLKEIELAAYMHDVGKISMPEYIIDKATKLEAFMDRIDVIQQRFEIVKRDLEISLLKKEISQESYNNSLIQINDDMDFLKEVNIGSEFMDEEKIDRILAISKYSYILDGGKIDFLSKNEIENLSIRKGTLTNQEKEIMNSHANLSFQMLSSLPFPKKYSNVLNIAANHHEKLNGKGYPRGLGEKDLSLEDRIMILADIFEALTASDRPYKEGKKLSEVYKILSFMVKDNEIDGNLLEFFFQSDAFKKYIHEELKPSQID